MQDFAKTVAMAFGGGLGLAAYHAGAYEALCKRSVRVHWLAGSSAGAVTAARSPEIQATEESSRFALFGIFRRWRTIGLSLGGIFTAGSARLGPASWAAAVIFTQLALN